MYTISVNGTIVEESKAYVPVLDRGFLYGDSVYEVMMTVQAAPVFLEEHLDRLENSANMIGMIIQCGRDRLKQDILHTLKAHGGERHYIRFIVTRGVGEITLDPEGQEFNNVIIIIKDLPTYPKEWYDKGISVIVADIIRNSKRAVDPNIKSGNYLNNILAMREAKKRGAFDAIMLNSKGYVTEATNSNLWIVKDGIFYTPPLNVGILSGITRKALFQVCKENGLTAQELSFTARQMISSDECFLTSTTKELIPVTKIDGRLIGNGFPGEWTKRLHGLYREYLQGRL